MRKRHLRLAAICLQIASLAAVGSASAAPGKVGVDYSLLTSPFWTAYDRYIKSFAKSTGVAILTPVNSDQDTAKQITDVNDLLNLGAAGLIVSPIDSAGIAPALHAAARRHVPVVTVDVAPDRGPVAMVVRADNKAYGEKACNFIGAHVGQGKVIEIMGDVVSINGRDRTEAFHACMKGGHPTISILDIPARWKSDVAAAGLDTLLTANPDIRAIYMQAGGVYLAATLQALRRHAMLHAAGTPGHVVIVSNDGIPQELAAIRSGEIDATVSQPADLYAKYGLFYVQAAIAGKSFAVGPTDHGSRIVQVTPGILEDELPAPLITRSNVDDKGFWANQL